MFRVTDLYRKARVIQVSERFFLELIIARIKGWNGPGMCMGPVREKATKFVIADPETLRLFIRE